MIDSMMVQILSLSLKAGSIIDKLAVSAISKHWLTTCYFNILRRLLGLCLVERRINIFFCASVQQLRVIPDGTFV